MIFSPDFFPESDYSQNFRLNRFCTIMTWIPKYCNNTIKREKKTDHNLQSKISVIDADL